MLAQAFLADTCEAVRRMPWAQPVVVTDGPQRSVPKGVARWHAGRGPFVACLKRCLHRALAQAPMALAVLAAAPGLPPGMLEEARQGLGGARAVLGSSDDGRLYLVGLRGGTDLLPADLRACDVEKADRLRRVLMRAGLHPSFVSPWFDVASPHGLLRLRQLLALRRLHAPATAKALKELGLGKVRRASQVTTTVIVPTLDEARRIRQRLAELCLCPHWSEIIVVDGGSRDETVAIARSFPGVRVLEAPRGRARQMNAAAVEASGDVLLFLHADVALPLDAARWIEDALVDPEVIAGAFRTWTVPDGGRFPLGPLLHLADLRSRYTTLPYGDQALFVRRKTFLEVGGFPDLPLMEDLELARRLRKRGRIRIVRACVQVSGRRFESHPIYYATLVNLLPLLHRLGVPPHLLARLYGNPR